GQSTIDIKEFSSGIVSLESLGEPPMYRERLGGIKGMIRYLFPVIQPSRRVT
ncbi:hypothetical protein WH47_09921, partial [Habropoda laboriosa]